MFRNIVSAIAALLCQRLHFRHYLDLVVTAVLRAVHASGSSVNTAFSAWDRRKSGDAASLSRMFSCRHDSI